MAIPFTKKFRLAIRARRGIRYKRVNELLQEYFSKSLCVG